MRRRRLHEILDWLGVVFVVLFIVAVLFGIVLALGWSPNFGGDEIVNPSLLN